VADKPRPAAATRLAACCLDSLAAREIPAIGYRIRYEFGIFDQHIEDGWQVELTDKWLLHGNPWEPPRPKLTFDIAFGGRTEHYRDEVGRRRVRCTPSCCDPRDSATSTRSGRNGSRRSRMASARGDSCGCRTPGWPS
jgi:glucan phosphorylase